MVFFGLCSCLWGGECAALDLTGERRFEAAAIPFHHGAGERLSALIENVLDFARLQRSKASYYFDEGSVVDVVSHAVDAYRYWREHKDVEIRLDVEPNLHRTSRLVRRSGVGASGSEPIGQCGQFTGRAALVHQLFDTPCQAAL